jgi:YD repeat-containing protein
MKKSISLLQSAAVCTIVTVLLFGCNKIESTAALDTDQVIPCQVQSMVFPPLTFGEISGARFKTVLQNNPEVAAAALAAVAAGSNDSVFFTYNALGNPVSIIHQTNFGDNLFFKYDHANRLTDFIAMYGGAAQGGDEWHKYTYDPHNTTRVIVDTTYIEFQSDNNKITSYEFTQLTTFKYDAQNRISQTTKTVEGDTTVTAYNYDSHGNLEGSGLVYDSKINVHRTNKLWMFLDKDYSINNQIDNGTYTYDQGNLPVKMATNTLSRVAAFEFMVVGYPNSMSTVTVSYSCE